MHAATPRCKCSLPALLLGRVSKPTRQLLGLLLLRLFSIASFSRSLLHCSPTLPKNFPPPPTDRPTKPKINLTPNPTPHQPTHPSNKQPLHRGVQNTNDRQPTPTSHPLLPVEASDAGEWCERGCCTAVRPPGARDCSFRDSAVCLLACLFLVGLVVLACLLACLPACLSAVLGYSAWSLQHMEALCYCYDAGYFVFFPFLRNTVSYPVFAWFDFFRSVCCSYTTVFVEVASGGSSAYQWTPFCCLASTKCPGLVNLPLLFFWFCSLNI